MWWQNSLSRLSVSPCSSFKRQQRNIRLFFFYSLVTPIQNNALFIVGKLESKTTITHGFKSMCTIPLEHRMFRFITFKIYYNHTVMEILEALSASDFF